MNSFYIILIFLFIVWINITKTLIYNNNQTIIYGLRWFYPFLILLLLDYKKEYLDIKFDKIFTFIFIIHFFIQIYQFLSGIDLYGSLGRFSARSPGIFLLPNTGAFFSIIFLYWLMFLSSKKKIIKIALLVISIISVFLTSSGTAIVVLMIVLYIYFLPQYYVILLPFFSIVSFLLMKYVLNITRGNNYIKISGGTRIKIFIDILKNTGLFSSNFGAFTNVAVLLGNGSYIADSTFSSLLGNLGLLFFLFCFFILLYLMLKSFLRLDKEKMAFIAIVLLFSSTTIILEAYPMNLLIPFFASYIYSNTKQKEMYTISN